MRIKIVGDDSISRQARAYAEYRLFAALSQVLDTGRVHNASLVLGRAKSTRRCDGVLCTVTVELNGGAVTRLRTLGEHPYAAINRAVERIRLNWRSARHGPSHREMVASE
jgi:ribosome-associated translation inhibitor RaiA